MRVARSAETVDDITLLVRTPEDVRGYRSFVAADRAEAESYTRQRGVEVEVLP